MKKQKRTILPMSDIRPINKEALFEAGEKKKRQQGISSVKNVSRRNPLQTKFSEEDKKVWMDYLAREDEKINKNETLDFKRKFSSSKRTKKKIGGKKIIFFKFGILLIIVVFSLNLIIRGLDLKYHGISNANSAVAEILSAKDSLKAGDFEKSYVQFDNAHQKLSQISGQFNGMGKIFVNATKYIPYASKLSSGSHLIAFGNSVSEVGVLASGILKNMDKMRTGEDQGAPISYLKIFHDNEGDLRKIDTLLGDAQGELVSVNLDDVPEKDRAQFIEIKKSLPEINNALTVFLGEEKLFNDILGGNGPRKYLFLFQNNQEMRSTGGFIGSYGMLDIFNGHVRNFFIDGIFNPDGQLKTRIVPPAPVQKISANWSLHDSNWFPNFPTSAEKAIWFYEKTGGPTTDGVITMTPTVMQKMLELTGPIDMPEYGITVDKDNFVGEIQYQVEVDYDKELNNPKKILGDLAPKILDKILNMKNFSEMSKAMNVLVESLNEKQILIYSKNEDIEKVLSQNGWSGEILNTPKDYLSVVNTNINGFKTDGVVKEHISHLVQIQFDGSIVDTVTIVRRHDGGDTPYEWWNKVNADYMRVYVPKGSKLLSADGQTREVDHPPLDYDALGYVRDQDVQKEAETEMIDPENGTKIYEEGENTVFANWVYVSPKETTTIKYTYLLPFKIDINSLHISDSYSLLTQKQSGSLGSVFSSEVNYPSFYKTLWQSQNEGVTRQDDLPNDEVGLKIESDLKTDKFFGIAFTK